MALSKTWVTPAEVAAGVSDRDTMNAQLGNLMLVLASVLFDGDDGTSSKFHRHGSSTLGNRPDAGNAGRLWRVTDIGDGIDMRDDGTKWVPLGVQVLERELTLVDVVDTTDETSLYSFEIPADLLGATGGVELKLGGRIQKNAAADTNLRIKLGATTVFDEQITLTSDASWRRWSWTIWFLNSAADAQRWSTDIVISRPAADAFIIHIADIFHGAGGQGSTEDTSGALTLDVTIEWSAADAANSWRMDMALLKVIPAA